MEQKNIFPTQSHPCEPLEKTEVPGDGDPPATRRRAWDTGSGVLSLAEATAPRLRLLLAPTGPPAREHRRPETDEPFTAGRTTRREAPLFPAELFPDPCDLFAARAPASRYAGISNTDDTHTHTHTHNGAWAEGLCGEPAPFHPTWWRWWWARRNNCAKIFLTMHVNTCRSHRCDSFITS